jgi:hypothetical protein
VEPPAEPRARNEPGRSRGRSAAEPSRKNKLLPLNSSIRRQAVSGTPPGKNLATYSSRHRPGLPLDVCRRRRMVWGAQTTGTEIISFSTFGTELRQIGNSDRNNRFCPGADRRRSLRLPGCRHSEGRQPASRRRGATRHRAAKAGDARGGRHGRATRRDKQKQPKNGPALRRAGSREEAENESRPPSAAAPAGRWDGYSCWRMGRAITHVPWRERRGRTPPKEQAKNSAYSSRGENGNA